MSVWGEFYKRLESNFKYAGRSSYLCLWLKSEKNRDFRLQLRKRRKALRDDPKSRRDFGNFMVQSLLEEPKIRPLQSSLKTLPPLLDCDPARNAEKGMAKQLRQFLKWLEEDQADPPQALLVALAAELQERYPKSAERTDAYVELQERFLDLEQGFISEADYLRSVLDLLQRRKRIFRDENKNEDKSEDKDELKFLWEYGRRAGGQDYFDGIGEKEAKYQRLRDLLGQPELPNRKRGDLKSLKLLHEHLLDTLLKADANNFLYDSNPANGRRKDRMMDLIDYCQEKGMTPFQNQQDSLSRKGAAPFQNQQSSISEKEMEDYERMFQDMRKDESRSDVLVPLLLDPVSGAGLYIVGIENLPVRCQNALEKKGAYCCYAYISFSTLRVDEDDYDNEFGSVSFTWYPINSMENEKGEMVKGDENYGFPSLKEAKSWYYHKIAQETLEVFYKGNNGEPPSNCPYGLLKYFEVEDDEDDFNDGLGVTPEEQEEIKEKLYKEFSELNAKQTQLQKNRAAGKHQQERQLQGQQQRKMGV